MLTILTSHKTILKVALCVTLCIVSAYYGYKYGSNKEAVKLLEYQNAQKALLLQVEKDNTDKLLSLQKDKENAIKDLNKRHASIVDSLRQRPERPSNPASEAASAPSVCTGAGSTGDRLYRQDAEFLIGEAARAEILKQTLKACRAQLENTNN